MRSIFSQLGAFVHHLRPGPSPIRRAPRRYLRLESLESRIALATDTFINLAGGFWDTDRNWSLGHPPASGDDAIIPALQPGASVLLLFSSTTNSLSLAGNLDIAGPLTIAGTVSGGGTITLQNGLTTTGSLSQAHVASDITLVVRGGILDGLTLDGNVLIANFQPVEVRNGLTVNGTVTLGDQVFPATPKFTGTQTIDGTGTILFSNRATDQLTVDSNGTLTIGSGVTLRGYDVSIYSGSSGYGNVVLEGSIYVDNIQPGALFGPLLRINANTTITSSGELRLGDGAVNAVIIPQLQNSGNITFGVGSQLGVQGTASTSFSQTSTGSMSINIGSLPMHIQPPLLHVYRQASLAGTLTATYVNGFVPPLGTSYLVVESITLTGTFTNVVGGTAVYQGGNVFLNAMPPVATQLVVTSQPPASVGTNQPFQVQISAEDASGHVVPSFTGSVTIQIASGTSNATLDGTLTVSAVNGVAAFSSLTLDEAGTFTLRATAAGLTSATTAAFVVVTDIVVTLTSTQNAATGVRPDSNQFMTTNSSLDFAPSTPNDLMVVVQDAGPLTVTSIGEPDPNAPLRWEIDRNPDDSVAAGLPALSATAGTQITVTPNVPGSFRLICYLDSDGNQTFEPGEQLTVLRLAIVRVTLQPNSDSITTTAVLTGGSRGISITTPMAIQADVLLEGGGADEMLGVDQIVLGDIGNLLGDSFTVDYPGGSTDAREGIEREDPDGMLDPAPGFPAPMIDTSRVAEGTEPTGGDTAFRFLSRDAIVGPGSAGGGQIRRVTVQDNPAYRWDYNHPMTMNPWATTVGSNAFREFVVVFSQTFTRNYVALASADWTVTVDGANVGGIWNDAGSTVTIQGGGASSAPLTVAGFPMTGDAAGVQTLGFSFVREYTMVAELVPPPMPPGGRGATRRVPQPLFESGSLAEETSPILAKLRLAYPPSGVTSPAKPTPASVQSSQAVTVTDQFFACIDEQESWSMLGAQTKFISQRPSSPNQRDGNLDVTTPFDLFVDVQHFGMV